MHGEGRGDESSRDLAAAAFKKGAHEEKDLVREVVVFYFERAAYTIAGEESIESVGAVRRSKVDVEPGGEELLFNGAKDGATLLENGAADKRKKCWG